MRAWKKDAFLIGLAALIALGALSYRLECVHQQIETSLPTAPNRTQAAPEFFARLADAERQAHHRWRGRAGLIELSRLYHANGFLPEAARIYRGLIAIDSSNARWFYLLGIIYTGYGQLDEGLPLLRRAVDLAPKYPSARLKLGDTLFKKGLRIDAIASYTMLLQLEPDNPYALLGLARSDIEDNKWSSAASRLRQAVQVHPKFAPGWTTLAVVCEHLGDISEATLSRETGEKVGRFREMPDPWVDELIDDCYDVYRLRIVASVSDNQKTARRLLERAVNLEPENAALQRQLGSTLVALGEIGRARVHYERAVAIDPNDADSWAYYVQVLSSMGDTVASARALVEGLSHCPTSPSLRYEHGRRLVAAGRLDEAAVEFRETRRLRPQEANSSVELAVIDLRQGRLEAAVAELHAALAAEPEHPFALEALTKVAIQSGDEPSAQTWLRRVRRQPRISGDAVEALVRAYRARFQKAP
jgi:tetratricopeptide (TPR) repeat protein